jgi:hypothetical protein
MAYISYSTLCLVAREGAREAAGDRAAHAQSQHALQGVGLVVPHGYVALSTTSLARGSGMASTGAAYLTAISRAMGTAVGPQLPVLAMERGGDVQIEGGGRI